MSPARLPASTISTVRRRSPPAEARPLAAPACANRRDLHWGQTYTAADFGQHFIDNYGWIELFGTRGHFANDAVAAAS